MDLNTVLIWIVSLSCFSLLLRVLFFHQHRGWIVVCGGILILVGILLIFTPQKAGLVAGSLWLIFVLLPLIGLRCIDYLFYQERFQAARRLASGLRWLHPADGWCEQPQLFRALEIAQYGDTPAAFALLASSQTRQTKMKYSTIAMLYRLEARWYDLMNWIRVQVPAKIQRENSTLMACYLRALGEIGDLNGLLWGLKLRERYLERSGNYVNLNLARMFALAFCGETHQVRRLFATCLSNSSVSEQQFWLATAELVNGNQSAIQQLQELKEKSDRALQKAIDWRLSHPPASPQQVLSDSSQEILNHLHHKIHQELRYGKAITLTFGKVYATYGLVSLNILVFMIEIFWGGSKNLVTLYQLGALVPEAVWTEGQWWRLVSANFLHFGYLHLVSNLLGLLFLGPYVELTLGIGRYLLVYFFSGIGAMLFFSASALILDRGDSFLVGASAAIMGLVGVTFAILWYGWHQEKSRIAAQRLRIVVFIILFQIAFDLSIPEVSFLGHAVGLILGLLMGTILLINWQFRDWT